MNISHLPPRWKRLFEGIAIPGWMLIGWRLIEIVHTLAFVGDRARTFWGFLTSPTGNLCVIAFGFAWVFAAAFWPRKDVPEIDLSRNEDARQTWFFPAGLSVSLQRGLETQTLLIYLHILSTKPTELIFVRLNVTDSTGLRIVCEHSEPLMVKKFETTAKMLEQEITTQELSKFQKGMPINLDGYAKFRDGDTIKQERIYFSTIPNV